MTANEVFAGPKRRYRTSIARRPNKTALRLEDTRNTGGPGVDVYAAVGIPGSSWKPNQKISTGTSNAATSRDPKGFGDYEGMAAYGGSFWNCWADNSIPSQANRPPNAFLDAVTRQVSFSGFSPVPAPSPPPAPGTAPSSSDTSPSTITIPAVGQMPLQNCRPGPLQAVDVLLASVALPLGDFWTAWVASEANVIRRPRHAYP